MKPTYLLVVSRMWTAQPISVVKTLGVLFVLNQRWFDLRTIS